MGSRSGCSHTVSRASMPWRERSDPHNVEASRSRRGRSSSPTSAAKVSSAGPPAARRRRTASCILAAAGIRSAVAWPTTSSTQPSTSASVVSRRVSAASWAGVFFGSNRPPSSACWIAAGSVGLMPADLLLHPGGVDGHAPAVVGDGRQEVLPQPRHVGEEALVRGLAEGEVEHHVVLAHVEARGERGHVGRQQGGLAGRSEREPDVGGGEHLGGQAADRLNRPGCRTSRHPSGRACPAGGRPSPAPPAGGRCPWRPRRSPRPARPAAATRRGWTRSTPRGSTPPLTVTPELNVVASSSQWSARRTASATWSCWAVVGEGSGCWATERRAMSPASVQFTAPSCGAIIACTWLISRPGRASGRRRTARRGCP